MDRMRDKDVNREPLVLRGSLRELAKTDRPQDAAMPRHAPTTQLEPHEVFTQPPPFAGRNLFDSDLALREAAIREGGDWVAAPLSALGAEAGSEAVLDLGELANQIGRAH